MKIILILVTGILTCGVCAQSIIFEETSFDFGIIPEEHGVVRHTYSFSNSSDEKLSITGVYPSCGCTVSDWNKEEIAPSGNGEITAIFDPLNRPGLFTKTLQVVFSNDTKIVLELRGEVKPKPRTILDDFPVAFGDINLQYRYLNMGRITTEQKITKTFKAYNSGDSSILFEPTPIFSEKHIVFSMDSLVLPSKMVGEFKITYDPSLNSELGYNAAQLIILTSDSKMERKNFSVISTVEEYFPPMSDDELAQAPKLVFEKNTVDFGRRVGVQDSLILTVSNPGNEPLNIREVKSNCDCVKYSLTTKDIDPNSTGQLILKFEPKGRRGRQYKTVTVFSNDPSAPTQVLSVKANVPDPN